MTTRNSFPLLLTLFLGLAAGSLFADEPAEVLLHDDFATLDPGWGDPTNVAYVQAGKLIIAPPQNGGHCRLNQSYVFDDMSVEVTTTFGGTNLAASRAGLVFWSRGYDDYCVAYITPEGQVGVQRLVKNRWINPVAARVSDLVHTGAGQQNHLRVTTRGNVATIFVNGKEAVSFKGQAQPGSFVGLYGESPAVTEFTDLKVTK